MKSYYVCCHCSLGVSCLNFNHVIIMKKITMFLHIMIYQNSKKIKCQKIIYFNSICCDVKIYDIYV
jgi:hypothetical protein